MADLFDLDPDLISLFPILIAFLTGVFGPLLLAYIRFKLGRKDKELDRRKQDFMSTLVTQEIINKNLHKVQSQYNLDRVWVAQFHNGSHFYPGNISMKKMSVTFESTSPGVAADIMKMQNLPVSFFSSALQKLSNGEDGVTVDVYTDEDNALRSFWEDRGVQTVYMFPIRCLESDFIGVFGVDFVKRDGFLTDEVYEQLKLEAYQLSGYVASVSIDKDIAKRHKDNK